MKKIAIVYSEPLEGSGLDSADTLDEVRLVEGALKELGYEYRTMPFSGQDGYMGLLYRLREFSPLVIFNLVEEIDGQERLHPAMAALYEIAGYPYTGASFDALVATTDKTITKAVLEANGLPTPKWQAYRGAQAASQGVNKVPIVAGEAVVTGGPWIVKPACEDASIGIDDESVFSDEKKLAEELPGVYERFGRQPILVERFVEGREFNVSLLGHADGSVEVFPPAEMLFVDWPAGKPRIVNYKAKWEEGSFEYENTVRTFKPENTPVESIRRIAIECWRVFGLRGYARVDMRLDQNNEPFVIEINANPCIAPWSGYVSAAKEAGYTEKELVRKIIDAALLDRDFFSKNPVFRKKTIPGR
ncbi:MAG: ATP-grasp domain-containing protein [Nitrospiraceae bacterium]|nr:ATP-grasp domain-containing protein [Nitrospiraceae bacterium]